jgi:hypothetical protein
MLSCSTAELLSALVKVVEFIIDDIIMLECLVYASEALFIVVALLEKTSVTLNPLQSN